MPPWREECSKTLNCILINGYLEELLLAQFKALVQTDDWSEDRAESFFEIGIGKTPPRKEPKWFSNDRKGNCVWLSIKDMAKSGAYSLDSAEYLTLDAVKQKNVRKVPEGSVLLSFKLTVGRVKIAACDMTTNEAIACFSSNDSRRLAYVFPYLLTYDYSKLGSTSSIATAVNSKTIKAMSITMPGDKELDSFYELSKPLYGQMLCIAKENAKLGLLRDTLLPKLMSGEIDVSKVDLTQLNSHLAQLVRGTPQCSCQSNLLFNLADHLCIDKHVICHLESAFSIKELFTLRLFVQLIDGFFRCPTEFSCILQHMVE